MLTNSGFFIAFSTFVHILRRCRWRCWCFSLHYHINENLIKRVCWMHKHHVYLPELHPCNFLLYMPNMMLNISHCSWSNSSWYAWLCSFRQKVVSESQERTAGWSGCEEEDAPTQSVFHKHNNIQQFCHFPFEIASSALEFTIHLFSKYWQSECCQLAKWNVN